MQDRNYREEVDEKSSEERTKQTQIQGAEVKNFSAMMDVSMLYL